MEERGREGEEGGRGEREGGGKEWVLHSYILTRLYVNCRDPVV